jgi:hypothetical protein
MGVISLIKMGHPIIDINRVIGIINKNQNKYNVISKDAIPNIGNSDLDDYAYSDAKLFNFLGRYYDNNSISIGITSVPLEGSWFLRPNKGRSQIVITIFEADSLLENAKRTLEEYVVYQILISIMTS